MFSLGQCVIISLASTIYLAGAAFLLTGCSVVSPIGRSEGGGCPSAAEKEFPHFYPVVRQNRDNADIGDAPLLAAETRLGASSGDPRFDFRAVGHENKQVDAGLLGEPICLN